MSPQLLVNMAVIIEYTIGGEAGGALSLVVAMLFYLLPTGLFIVVLSRWFYHINHLHAQSTKINTVVVSDFYQDFSEQFPMPRTIQSRG